MFDVTKWKKKSAKKPPSIIEARHFGEVCLLLVPGRQWVVTQPEVTAELRTAWGLNAGWSNAGCIARTLFAYGH